VRRDTDLTKDGASRCERLVAGRVVMVADNVPHPDHDDQGLGRVHHGEQDDLWSPLERDIGR
jgi:hypothetical protein